MSTRQFAGRFGHYNHDNATGHSGTSVRDPPERMPRLQEQPTDSVGRGERGVIIETICQMGHAQFLMGKAIVYFGGGTASSSRSAAISSATGPGARWSWHRSPSPSSTGSVFPSARVALLADSTRPSRLGSGQSLSSPKHPCPRRQGRDRPAHQQQQQQQRQQQPQDHQFASS
ncbi:hypothetical protein BDW68DRAFT_180445 [Aspergillus falconensis]